MRFALIAMLVLLLSCTDNDIITGHYEESASLLYSNNAKCEEMALKYHDLALKSNDISGIAKYSYLLGLVNSENDKYKVASDFLYNSIDKFRELGDVLSLAKSLYALGYLHNQYANYGLAKKCFDRALLLNFNNEELQFKISHKMADVCIGIGKKDTAFEIANTVLLNFPNISEPRKFRSIGYLYIKAEDYGNAIKYLDKSIKIDKHNEGLGNCYLNLAYAYLKTNKITLSLGFINKALVLNNGKYSGEILRTRARALIQLKEYELASKDLDASLKYKINHDEITEGYKLISKGHKEAGNESKSLLFAIKAIDSYEKKERYMNERSEEAQAVREDIIKNEYEKQLNAEERANIYLIIIFVIVILVAAVIISKFIFKLFKVNNYKKLVSGLLKDY